MTDMATFFVYVDYKKDTGVPFYVGKGVKSRVFKSRKRNAVHTRIAAKHGCCRLIVNETQDEQLALSLEVELIRRLGTKAPFGANLTDGGEGTVGRVVSRKTRELVSRIQKAKVAADPTALIERRKLAIEAWRGRHHSDAARERIAQSAIGNQRAAGYVRGEETRRKMSQAKLGKAGHKHSETTKRKMSAMRAGTPGGHAKGKTATP